LGEIVKQVLLPAVVTTPNDSGGDARQISDALQQLAVNALGVCDGSPA
jgi:hypothetical protein